MSVTTFTIHERFEQLTGRKMTAEENTQLRNILAQAPNQMEQSPSFVYQLLVSMVQAHDLQTTIQEARKAILEHVETESGPVTERLLQKVLKKAHESSPSAELAVSKAFYMGVVGFFASFLLAFLFFLVIFSFGLVRPQWFTEESYAKIRFASQVQEAVGGSVDWHRREAPYDESLSAVLKFAVARGTNADPYLVIRLYESCRYPGQQRHPVRGKVMCRYNPPI